MQKRYFVTMRCANGHTQTIETQGMTREMAEDFAGLMDGTSRFFVHAPLPGSKLHKCAICGAQIRCTVADTKQS